MKKYFIITREKNYNIAAIVNHAKSKLHAEQEFNSALVSGNDNVQLLDIEQRGDYKAVVA